RYEYLHPWSAHRKCRPQHSSQRRDRNGRRELIEVDKDHRIPAAPVPGRLFQFHQYPQLRYSGGQCQQCGICKSMGHRRRQSAHLCLVEIPVLISKGTTRATKGTKGTKEKLLFCALCTFCGSC